MNRPLPPNQVLAAPGKWPLVGERTAGSGPAEWAVSITGCINRECRWTTDELRSLDQHAIVTDIHCVTRWSRLDVPFRGVPLAVLLDEAGVTAEARFLSFVARSDRGHSSSLPLADALAAGTLIALEADNAPLTPEHGGPVRVVVPGRYFYKSVKWLERIEVLAEDRLGYWEADVGYHNGADPWREERYVAADIDRATIIEVFAARDFSGRELRSIAAANRDLAELKAAGASLRDADFRGSTLRNADFSNANLSNAHFEGADLRGASFAGADIEGANFAGASIEGVDFRGTSLFGATFVGPPTATIDRSTRFEDAGLDALAPADSAFIRERAAT